MKPRKVYVGTLTVQMIHLLRDRDITSDRAMLNILGWAAYEAAYAGVLHAGGFW